MQGIAGCVLCDVLIVILPVHKITILRRDMHDRSLHSFA